MHAPDEASHIKLSLAALLEEIANLDMPRAQHFGGLEEVLFSNIRQPLSLSLQKPVRQKFQLDIEDTVVTGDLLHFFRAVLFENMFEVGMPDAETFEPRTSSRSHAIFEIERAILPVVWGMPAEMVQ